MKLTRYTDLAAYRDAVMDFLALDEVANNMPIGLILRGLAEGGADGWLMAAVTGGDGALQLAALRTPPHNLLLAERPGGAPEEALRCLADGLRGEDPALPGVLADRALARRFAALWAGRGWHTHLAMKVMRLDSLTPPPPPPGRARALEAADLHFAPYWGLAFAEDCGVHKPTLEEMADSLRRRAGQGGHLLWLDEAGTPVSQAAMGRGTLSGAVISHVYTPPWYRGKGYAAAVVAALCARLLEAGHRYCALFADAANPTSCGIYRRLGFRDVCIHEEVVFTGAK